MARSTFYYHLKALSKADKYEVVRERICEIFKESKGRYGYRRVTLQLRNEGFTINHKTVERLMNEHGLMLGECTDNSLRLEYLEPKEGHGIFYASELGRVALERCRTYKGTIGKIAPNILNRDFRADVPYQKLVTDVSQISIGAQKSFLSPILDLFNGEVLCYDISDRADLEQIGKMLADIFAITDKLPDGQDILLHSDQGWRYQHKSYQDALAEHGIIQSMSRKGNCLDNSVMENFFGLMKSELLYANDYSSIEEFKQDLVEYIDWYNNKRIKAKLNGMSPVQYRAQYHKKL